MVVLGVLSLTVAVSILVEPSLTAWAAETPVETPKDRVTIDVKDTDITRVLDAFSQQTGLNVVVGKEVTGSVTVRLRDVPWDQALEALLKPYGFGYQRTGDVIVVLPLDKLSTAAQAEPLVSRVFKLNYVDAGDVKGVVDAQLSPRGKAQILEITGQKGWDFGTFGVAGSSGQSNRMGTGSQARVYKGSGERRSMSKALVVTDVPSVITQVEQVIVAIDLMPRQILIESRFMEVNRDRLKDLGLDYATGSSGAGTAAVETVSLDKTDNGTTRLGIGGQSIGSLVTPASFGPKATSISGISPFGTGLSLAFKKFTGTQFDILLHALEEDIHTNTLSAPSIMTLDGQEANILVGTQFPILTSSVVGTTSTTSVSSLDYYQDIGVQLRVVPQIAGEEHINMIVHPAVTSVAERITAQGTGGVTLAEYPVITTREAETQILIKNGETVMIGGLLKDVKTKGFHKVPVLGDIPVLGLAFRRQTDDIEKIDLLIFITGKIASEAQVAAQQPVFTPAEPGPDATIQWQQP
jgi:type IV pilus assembly protein PilQ